jgi:aminoglycoside phosphotransferase
MLSPSTDMTVETCLDPIAMRKLLQATLPDFSSGNRRIDDLRIVKSRRNTSKQRNPNPLTLCYEIDVRDNSADTHSTQQFYGKVYRNGASALAKRNTQTWHVAQLDMLLWTWPDDPGLPQLPQLLDSGATQTWWGESAHEMRALRYVPEDRATLCYLRRPSGGSQEQLFVKTFCDERGKAIYERFMYFWELAQRITDAPLVAQPLSYCTVTHSLWQAQATGVSLAQALSSAEDSSLASSLARAMDILHAAPLSLAGSSVRDTAHWMSEIRRRCNKISRAVPALADRVTRIADLLEHVAECLRPHQPTLIHGDFHPEQVWIDGERIVLFDFDEFTLGDPMEDLAEFITKIQPGGADSEFATQLLMAYALRAPERFDHKRLQWHLAVQQLLQASRAFVFQIPHWRNELEQRLTRTETLCALLAMDGVV